MILHSTNGISGKVSLPQGVANGLAPDGGLYMPDVFPKLPQALFNNLTDMTLQDISYVIATTLFGDLVDAEQLKKIVTTSIDFDIPLTHITDSIFMVELFHGPTMSFKDVGAQFMANLLPVLDPLHGETRNIIVATSGDSGGAIANGFSRAANTRVFVLFPRGELTREQVAQFATVRNVVSVEVNGSFDDCQRIAKEVLAEDAVHGTYGGHLTSGNSINLLRQLPSIIYYFHAYARAKAIRPDNDVVISVPCGNLGNLSAGLMAKRMGLPAKRFIAANNANDAFVDYLKTGGFSPRERLVTIAKAMDVGNPSNLARILDLYNDNLEQIRNDVEGVAFDDATIVDMMRRLENRHDLVVDPHTASAFAGLEARLRPGETGIALACAHPTKFSDAVREATGRTVKRPHPLALMDEKRDLHINKIPPTFQAFRRILKENSKN